MREATARVLRDTPREALQYAASEGYAPLREWVAEQMAGAGPDASMPSQVLITTGSQQGLDLVGKVLIDAGSARRGRVADLPRRAAGLRRRTSREFVAVAGDDDGPLPEALARGRAARASCTCCRTSRTRAAAASARRGATRWPRGRSAIGLPLVEDNPYGDLWFDAAAAAPLASRWPDGTLYLGSFSKVLAPGLRLGYVVAPRALLPEAAAGQAGGRPAHAGLQPARRARGDPRRLPATQHVPTIRARYRAQRDAMQRRAGARTDAAPAATGTLPSGGMFFWLELPAGIDADGAAAAAVERGVAFVPGAAFYAGGRAAEHPAAVVRHRRAATRIARRASRRSRRRVEEHGA